MWCEGVHELSWSNIAQVICAHDALKSKFIDQQQFGVSKSDWKRIIVVTPFDDHQLPIETAHCINAKSVCANVYDRGIIYEYLLKRFVTNSAEFLLDGIMIFTVRIVPPMNQFYDCDANEIVVDRIPVVPSTAMNRPDFQFARRRLDVLNAVQIPVHGHMAMSSVVYAVLYKVGVADVLRPIDGQQVSLVSRILLKTIGADWVVTFVFEFTKSKTHVEFMSSSLLKGHKGFHNFREAYYDGNCIESADVVHDSRGRALYRRAEENINLKKMWHGTSFHNFGTILRGGGFIPGKVYPWGVDGFDIDFEVDDPMNAALSFFSFTEVIDEWLIGTACYSVAYPNGAEDFDDRTRFFFDGFVANMLTNVVKGKKVIAPVRQVMIVLVPKHMMKPGAIYMRGPICPPSFFDDSYHEFYNWIKPFLGACEHFHDVEFPIVFGTDQRGPFIDVSRVRIVSQATRLLRLSNEYGIQIDVPQQFHDDKGNTIVARGESFFICFSHEEYMKIAKGRMEHGIDEICPRFYHQIGYWCVANDIEDEVCPIDPPFLMHDYEDFVLSTIVEKICPDFKLHECAIIGFARIHSSEAFVDVSLRGFVHFGIDQQVWVDVFAKVEWAHFFSGHIDDVRDFFRKFFDHTGTIIFEIIRFFEIAKSRVDIEHPLLPRYFNVQFMRLEPRAMGSQWKGNEASSEVMLNLLKIAQCVPESRVARFVELGFRRSNMKQFFVAFANVTFKQVLNWMTFATYPNVLETWSLAVACEWEIQEVKHFIIEPLGVFDENDTQIFEMEIKIEDGRADFVMKVNLLIANRPGGMRGTFE